MATPREVAQQFKQPMRKQFIIAHDNVKLRAKFVDKGLVICTKDGEYLSDQWLQFLLDGKAKIIQQ